MRLDLKTWLSPSASRSAFTSTATLAAAVAALPSPVLAHASERGHVLLLPTGHYLAGGAVAVIATFAVLALRPPRPEPRGASRLGGWRLARLPAGLRLACNALSTALLLVLVAAGVSGSPDPLANPLPLAVWSLFWVGLTVAQGLVGDVWTLADPWRAPVFLLRRLGLRPRLRVPPSLGALPALPLFFAFAWFELVDLAPDDPRRLGAAVLAYWLFSLAAFGLFGFRAWRRTGEFFSILFSALARLSMVWSRPDGRAGRVLGWRAPAAGLVDAPPLEPAAALVVLFALAAVSFDGLSKTFAFLGLFGVNPLEFPGRSSLIGINTLGLVATAAAMVCAFLGSVAAGLRWTASGVPLAVAAGLLVWSLVPIALAYHFAHYLPEFAVQAQYGLAALSDPFGRGWNLFGTAHLPVRAGIAAGSGAAWVIWNLQAGAIVAGHVLAVVAAHRLGGRLAKGRGASVRLLSPLTALMVLYTLFGLWLLSTPAAG